jgi:subtilisin family serine protease
VDFALSRNVVVVAAAGNDEQSGTGPFYPAAYPGVLSVGAVQPDGSLASFSDTRTPVSVTAPGVNITSAYPGTFPDAYDPGDNGTSFAAAFVSGVVALVRSYYPGLDEAQVVARIEATADGPAGPGTGHGLVNPVQAVTAVLPAARVSSASGSAPGGHPAHVAITRGAPPDRSARIVSLVVSAGSFGILVVLLAAATLTSAARRRPGPGEADRGPLPHWDVGSGPRSRRNPGEGEFQDRIG